MKRKLFLGIDTSNYTTSVSVADENGEILLNFKKLLSVKQGERGLRQSDAVFQHIKNSEEASSALRSALREYDGDICAVGVSGTPTYADGSYMPCFMTGLSFAQMVSSAMQIPMYVFSHQAGHIMAAVHSAGKYDLLDSTFAAFHVSGGTTDIIKVTPDSDRIILPEIIGGTLDINAGQAIDRAGVMMGLGFPAGREMEKLALSYSGKIPKLLCCVSGMSCNLSGLENKAAGLFKDTNDMALVSAYVIASVGVTLSGMLSGVYDTLGDVPVIFAGGVMSCSILKEKLAGSGRFFAKPEFASDNACGTALLARLKYYQK